MLFICILEENSIYVQRLYENKDHMGETCHSFSGHRTYSRISGHGNTFKIASWTDLGQFPLPGYSRSSWSGMTRKRLFWLWLGFSHPLPFLGSLWLSSVCPQWYPSHLYVHIWAHLGHSPWNCFKLTTWICISPEVSVLLIASQPSEDVKWGDF